MKKRVFKYLLGTACLMSVFLVIFFHYRNLQYENDVGKTYCYHIDYLDSEIQTFETYLSELEKYNIEHLFQLYVEFFERAKEFDHVPQKLPMSKRIYSPLLHQMSGDISALIDIRRGNSWMDEKYIRNRLGEACKLLRWSFSIIRENAGKYSGKRGYFKELYVLASKTHRLIDPKLEAFLRDKYHVNTSR